MTVRRYIPPIRPPRPKFKQDLTILDDVLDTRQPPPPGAPLYGTIAINEPPQYMDHQRPDEPPPYYDPLYSAMDAHTRASHLKGAAVKRAKTRLANKTYNHALIEAMGDHGADFEKALSYSNNPKIKQFMIGITSPKFKDWSTTRIASHFGIGPDELATIWKDYHLARAMLSAVSAIPKMIDNVANDALSGQLACPHCDGRTTVKVEIQAVTPQNKSLKQKDLDEPKYKIVVCPQCNGEGVIFKPGHEHSRDKLLQIVGWGQKAASTNININQNMQFGGVESVIEELEREKITPAVETPNLDAIMKEQN